MAEPLKNLYTKELIKDLAERIKSCYTDFNHQGFVDDVFNSEWPDLEFKERMRHITMSLKKRLPEHYQNSIDILKQVSKDVTGLVYLSFPDFVEIYGLHDFEVSVPALKHFTSSCSSEFAVRPFILKYGDRMMDIMDEWTSSENEHVRRLASEGCRPRLPWAMALPVFKQNPSRVLKLLENLQDDPSEYVRRSVANNLNDISKDHPNEVIQTAQQWYGKTNIKDRLIKHALRTLLKQGNPDALSVFGYKPPDHITVNRFRMDREVYMGQVLNFSFEAESEKESLGLLRLDFSINFMKSKGKLSEKVFQISDTHVTGSLKKITKGFSFKKITTRKYYPGRHELSIIINGVKKISRSFQLME